MSDIKKFFELLAKDNTVKAELERASFAALKKLIEDNGLEAAAEKALIDARAKVAEAYGLNLRMEEVSPEELKAVSGGSCSEDVFRFFDRDIPAAWCWKFSD